MDGTDLYIKTVAGIPTRGFRLGSSPRGKFVVYIFKPVKMEENHMSMLDPLSYHVGKDVPLTEEQIASDTSAYDYVSDR